ncbi:MAG: hypothetical protein GXP26_16155 [Planctomycetes bacterium]|nr:hypothetical protein [Planctomycetota bacterium]
MDARNDDREDAHTEPSVEDIAFKDLDRVFSNWGELKDRLRNAASYLRFIGSRLDPHTRDLRIPDELANRFESLSLWIRKIMPELPPEVREQAIALLDDTKTEQTIVTLHTLGEDIRRRLRFRQSSSFVVMFANVFGLFKTGLDESIAELVSEEQLQIIKVALGRLAGMLEYAAEDLSQDEEIDDIFYRQHYDPQLVDRARVLVLLNSITLQLESLPDDEVKKHLLQNVERLKREASRSRPRWRSFLGNALIILAIIADIKTMHPDIGEEILRTIDVVIQTVVSECQVTPNRMPNNNDQHGPKHWALQPKRIEFKGDAEDD